MRLFLYGTLQPGAGTAMAQWLRPRIVTAERASVPGQLHAIPSRGGWYPALRPGTQRCRGTLVRTDLSRADLAYLDRYEGAEYRRRVIRARSSEARVSAWAYVWQSPLPPGAVPIMEGDFVRWLTRNRRQSYGSAPGAGRLEKD